MQEEKARIKIAAFGSISLSSLVLVLLSCYLPYCRLILEEALDDFDAGALEFRSLTDRMSSDIKNVKQILANPPRVQRQGGYAIPATNQSIGIEDRPKGDHDCGCIPDRSTCPKGPAGPPGEPGEPGTPGLKGNDYRKALVRVQIRDF